MAHNAPISYSAALSNNNKTQETHQSHANVTSGTAGQASRRSHVSRSEGENTTKRSPSPSHIPKTASPEDNVYVLTLLTDRAHHARMTELRTKYFPKAINKLAAHLTLFHALPGSKLDSHILPLIEQVASQTVSFQIEAAEPFRLKKGIAISVPAARGGREGRRIHTLLRDKWKRDGFLSEQDAGGCRLHYTIMNKVDDEKVVEKALGEVRNAWSDDIGTVEGLALWRYERGFWRWERKFPFSGRG